MSRPDPGHFSSRDIVIDTRILSEKTPKNRISKFEWHKTCVGDQNRSFNLVQFMGTDCSLRWYFYLLSRGVCIGPIPSRILTYLVLFTDNYFSEFQPQCLGPKCCKPARRKSKYCSDSCGRALAAKRIERFLIPKLEKMAEYPSVATIEQTAKLEKLKANYNTILKGSG